MKAWLAVAALAVAVTAQAAPIDDLVIAAELNDPRVVLSLLLKGVDPNQADSRGRKAIFIALRENSLRALDSLLASPQLKVDEPNAQGETPLMIAARYGNSDLVPLLLKAGAEPRAANEQELTVADFAARGGRDVMAKELRRVIQERQRAADAAK